MLPVYSIIDSIRQLHYKEILLAACLNLMSNDPFVTNVRFMICGMIRLRKLFLILRREKNIPGCANNITA